MTSSPAPPSPAPASPAGLPGEGDRELVDAFIAASRALVAVAARSLTELGDDVTLPQVRVLVVLATRGRQRVADLAEAMQVTPSTASRMIERLVRKGLVDRTPSEGDRRTVFVELTAGGQQVVAAVMDRRRAEIEEILAHMPSRGRRALIANLRSFAEAAGEVPEPDWALGWGT